MQFEYSIIAYKMIIWYLNPALIVTEIINYVILLHLGYINDVTN